ncbi:MAG: class I SAM-dependent methyltransferase [Myxococcales bacterium]
MIENYFETTSGALRSEPLDYARATAGLRRGLGDWLDVAGRSVLDLGCGTGEMCWLAQDLGAARVVGVNLSQGEIDYAKRGVDAEFVHADALAFLRDSPTGGFDRIFALNILEHLPHDTLLAVLEECQRTLAPGGTLVAMVPNATSSHGSMTRYWDVTHVSAFTPSSVQQLARLSGFGEPTFREWGPVPYGAVSTLRYLLWQGFRGITWLRLMAETASGKGGIYTSDMIFRLHKRNVSGA